MFCRIGFLKLSLIVGVLGLGFALSLGAQSPQSAQSGNANNVQTLMLERRDVLTKLVQVLKKRYEQGLMQIDAVYRAENELLSLEIELAKTPEERLAAMKTQLENFQLLEKQATERQKVGSRGGEVEAVLAATSNRLNAEIQILRESAKDK